MQTPENENRAADCATVCLPIPSSVCGGGDLSSLANGRSNAKEVSKGGKWTKTNKTRSFFFLGLIHTFLVYQIRAAHLLWSSWRAHEGPTFAKPAKNGTMQFPRGRELYRVWAHVRGVRYLTCVCVCVCLMDQFFFKFHLLTSKVFSCWHCRHCSRRDDAAYSWNYNKHAFQTGSFSNHSRRFPSLSTNQLSGYGSPCRCAYGDGRALDRLLP